MTRFASTGAAALALSLLSGTAAFAAPVTDATVAFLMPDLESVMRGGGRMRDAGYAIEWGPGRHGPGTNASNYVIGPSPACPGLIHVAAIRSTGLSASLGIAERVVSLVAEQGVVIGPDRPLAPGPAPGPAGPWWQRTALHRAAA